MDMNMYNKTILIADDSEINRDVLRFIFEEQFDILESEDGAQVIDILEKERDRISMIFLDLVMPNKTGLDVLDYMNKENYIATKN